MTTWGDEDDFKHFFPRLLELSLSAHDINFLALLYKVSFAEWSRWTLEGVWNRPARVFQNKLRRRLDKKEVGFVCNDENLPQQS